MSRLLIATLAAAILLPETCPGADNDIDTDTHAEHNFNSGNKYFLGPFETNNTSNGNYCWKINNRMKCFWDEDNYTGSRGTQGAEIRCANTNHDLTVGEYWVGFQLLVPSSYRDDTNTIIHQNFQNGSGRTGWFAVFDLQDDDLILTYRYAKTSSATTNYTIINNMNFGDTYNIITRFRPNDRRIQVWVDEVRVIDLRDVDVGFEPNEGRGCKWGMYCHDVGDFNNGESRIIYFDNVAHLLSNKADGYHVVNPE